MESNIEKSSKRGRPEKSKANLKSKRVTMRVTESQLEHLTLEASRFGLTLSEYCYHMIMSKEVKAPFTKEEIELKRGIVAVGNNVNQIARKAHQQGIVSIVDEAKEILRIIRKMVDKYDS